VTRAPFSVQEEGWGEFDLVITVHFHHSSETFRIIHDLNFHEGESYFKHYKFNMPGASPEFLALFNQRPGAARKTLPPAGAKAQKAPPRDAGRSKPHSSPYSNDYSDSLSSYSDNSDSDDSSAKRSNHSGRSKAQSISSGASGSSRKRARDTTVRRADEVRSTVSTKQIPRENDTTTGLSKAAARQDGRSTVSYKQKPVADASNSAATSRAALKDRTRLTPSPPLQPSRGVDARHQRTQLNGVRSAAKTDRESRPSIRRTSNASNSGDTVGTTRQRRSPSDASLKARTGTAAIPSARMQQLQGQSDRRQSAAGRSSTTVEKPITPVNRADRSAAAGVAGVKRRLADSMVFSASTSIPLRQTLAPAEMLKASVSPTLGPDAHTDATMSYTNMSLAAGIAGVKVPKKRDRVIKTENESDQPSSKIARTEPEPAHALKRPDGDIPSINSVNREMKRVLEKAREKSSQSAAA
ncbi:hypothetical protein IW150_006978, partial [Coemansia sp. RSA 2607]